MANVVLIAVAVFVAAMSTAALASPPPTEVSPADYTLLKSLPYGPDQADNGDLYIPKVPACYRPFQDAGCQVPVVVIPAHNGVYCIHGDIVGPQPLQSRATIWAYAGFLSFVIQYDPLKATCGLTGGRDLQATQLAVRWLRATGHSLGFQFSQLAFFTNGGSGNGYEAMTLGFGRNIEPGPYASKFPAMSVQMLGVFDMYGPGGGPDGSVMQLITPQSPPTYILQGSYDCLVPPAVSVSIYNALVRAGVPTKIAFYDGDHDFAYPPPQDDCRLRLPNPPTFPVPQIYSLMWPGIEWLAAQYNIAIAH